MFEFHFSGEDLSLSESLSLLYVSTRPARKDLPAADAARLIWLGLVRVSDGWLFYTHAGEELANRISALSQADLAMVN